MKRTHNSVKELKVFKNKKQEKNGYSDKPIGLWYEINNSWKQWCKNEMSHWLKAYLYEYKLEINENKILKIKSKYELYEFTNKYKLEINENTDTFIFNIDWIKISQKYYGIEINPYLYECRLDTNFMWYYGWDCASGCIWNKKAIINIIKEN